MTTQQYQDWLHPPQTTIRSVAALRTLADRLESCPPDSATIRVINETLSNIPGEHDHHRILWLLLHPGR